LTLIWSLFEVLAIGNDEYGGINIMYVDGGQIGAESISVCGRCGVD